MLLLCPVSVLSADQASRTTKVTSPIKATTSRSARLEALQSIPWQQLDEGARQRVADVTKATSIFRRLPVQVFPCDPDLYSFLVDHPEVVVNVWDVLGLSKVVMNRTGPDQYEADDGAGTTCQLAVVHRSQDTRIVYAEGLYEGPMFSKPIRGRCVLILKSNYLHETDGKYYVTNRLDAFIDIEQIGVELLAKTFQPWIGKVADYNFAETANFVSSLSHTAEINPLGVQRLAVRLAKVDPALKQEFAQLTALIAARASEREAQTASATRVARLPASGDALGEQ